MAKSNQVNGKAFEYSLLQTLFERLRIHTPISIIENAPLKTARNCFLQFNEVEQGLYNLNSSFAVNFLFDLEPRLHDSISNEDILELEIVSDSRGQQGDVRDVLAIRSKQNWEIGISAKNNHRAVKHQRLSHKIDFGKSWLGLNCSTEYFDSIQPIFYKLQQYRKDSCGTKTWESLGDYHSSVYVPILDAFKVELLRLNRLYPGEVAQRLVTYLIGKEDFYKIIKGRNKVEILAFNLHGTLNLPSKNTKPKFKVPKLKLPSKLIDVSYFENSKTTLLVTLNEGWQISFRIHNASSRIESSLKFDVNLVSAPHSLFSNHLALG